MKKKNLRVPDRYLQQQKNLDQYVSVLAPVVSITSLLQFVDPLERKRSRERFIVPSTERRKKCTATKEIYNAQVQRALTGAQVFRLSGRDAVGKFTVPERFLSRVTLLPLIVAVDFVPRASFTVFSFPSHNPFLLGSSSMVLSRVS